QTSDICAKVGRILEKQRADIVIEADDHVVLSVPFVRSSGNNSDFVAPLNRIELRLRHGDGLSFLCYRLSVVRTAIICCAIPPMLLFDGSALKAPLDSTFAIKLILGGWAGLVGGNCGAVWVRARPFFERAVREASSAPVHAQQSSDAPTAT